MRTLKIGLALSALAALGACQDEPENIQSRADNQAAALENGYQILEAEAANEVASAAEPLENEAAASLLNRMESGGGNETEPVPGNTH